MNRPEPFDGQVSGEVSLEYPQDHFHVAIDQSDDDDPFSIEMKSVQIRLEKDGSVSLFWQNGHISSLIMRELSWKDFHAEMEAIVAKGKKKTEPR